jgi:hypothetical protein
MGLLAACSSSLCSSHTRPAVQPVGSRCGSATPATSHRPRATGAKSCSVAPSRTSCPSARAQRHSARVLVEELQCRRACRPQPLQTALVSRRKCCASEGMQSGRAPKKGMVLQLWQQQWRGGAEHFRTAAWCCCTKQRRPLGLVAVELNPGPEQVLTVYKEAQTAHYGSACMHINAMTIDPCAAPRELECASPVVQAP